MFKQSAIVAALVLALPAGYALTVVRDETQYIKASVATVQEHLLIGALLASAVVFLFLRNGRAALIPSVAVPVSLLGAFIRRDARIQLSYRSDLALQLFTIVFNLAMFFYIAKLVDDGSRSNRQMDEIHRALAENLVIFFRDQHIAVVGGGDSAAAIRIFGLDDQVDHLSHGFV